MTTAKRDALIQRKRRLTARESQKKLSYLERPGYHRRFVNELPGRVEFMQDLGYNIVFQEEENNSKTDASSAHQVGTPVRIVVNKRRDAPCSHAVLMEIPEEFYNEDQLYKQEEVNKIEAGFKVARNHGADRATYRTSDE